jgi:protein arginine N-methyltransferase 1
MSNNGTDDKEVKVNKEEKDTKEVKKDDEAVNKDAKAVNEKVDEKVDEKDKDSFLEKQKEKTSSDYYWNSYAHFSIHEEMLKDEVRTLSYRKAIVGNPHLFKDKIVLDVGCGTGILSMFASQAGAAHVYAVDCSDIIQHAEQIIKDNGFEGKITCIQTKVEELKLPGDIKVDVIISEWMGYYLLYESMLNTVIYARDHFLKEGGVIMPDEANLYIAGIEDADYKAEKLGFWENVYGFNMSCIQRVAYVEPLVDVVQPDYVVTSPSRILKLDLYTCKVEDLSFKASYDITASKNDYMHAFISWFDIRFTKCHKPIFFSTAPHHKYTHWKQTVFYLEDTLSLCDGDKVTGTVETKPNQKNPRDLDITIDINFEGKYEKVHKTQEFLLR